MQEQQRLTLTLVEVVDVVSEYVDPGHRYSPLQGSKEYSTRPGASRRVLRGECGAAGFTGLRVGWAAFTL